MNPKRQLPIALAIALLLASGFGLYMALQPVMVSWVAGQQTLDVRPHTLVVSAATEGELDSIRERLVQGLCSDEMSCGGDWTPLKRFSLREYRASRESGLLLVSSFSSQVFADSRLGTEMALALGETHGMFRAWVNGVFVGNTSRYMEPGAKTYPFTVSDAFSIPRDLLVSDSRVLLVIEAQPLQNPAIYDVFNISMLVFFQRDIYVEIEMLKHLTLMAVIMLNFGLGTYHLGIWIGRRDPAFLGLAIFSFIVFLQAGVQNNLFKYLYASDETIWWFRNVTVNLSLISYVAFRLFARLPVSNVIEHLRLGGEGSGFSKLSRLEKSICVVSESVFFGVFPALAMVSAVSGAEVGAFVTFRISVAVLVIANIATFGYMVFWLMRRAFSRNIIYALPLSFGLGVAQAGSVSAGLATAGVESLSRLSLAYSTSVTLLLFAVSLGQQFNHTYFRVSRLKSDLELLLAGTRKLGLAREVLDATCQVVEFVRSSLGTRSSYTIWLLIADELIENGQPAKSYLLYENGQRVPVPRDELVEVSLPHEGRDMLTQGLLYVVGQELLVPLRSSSDLVGYLRIGPLDVSEFSADRQRFVQTIAASLGATIDRIHATQRDTAHLVERVTLAAKISDRLNSPLTALLNGIALLQQRLVKNHALDQDESLAPRLKLVMGAAAELEEVSHELALLREGSEVEATALLEKEADKLCDGHHRMSLGT